MSRNFAQVTIFKCSSCGDDHRDLPTQPVDNPIFALCPKTGDKVFFRTLEN